MSENERRQMVIEAQFGTCVGFGPVVADFLFSRQRAGVRARGRAIGTPAVTSRA